jgi:MFS family permease
VTRGALTGAVVISPAAVTAPTDVSAARRWSMLGAATFAQGASAATVHGPAFLIPVLHDRLGLTLAEAGLMASAPLVGMMLALLGWGLVVDRRGERFALLAGLGLATAASAVAALSGGVVAIGLALLVAGTGSAATAAATGRTVVGWFPAGRRGLAMGIRQMAQPLGVGLGAATIAVIAEEHGIGAALWLPTAGTAIGMLLVALVVLDPPRPAATAERTASPYRADTFLVRLHVASVLLIVPQFLVWTFALTWLIDDLGWAAGLAGTAVLVSQLLGATARVGSGWLSDRVGSRMRPMRWVALAAAATMLALGAAAALPGTVAAVTAVLLMGLASAVTVADNGLAFTAVAERAGPYWSGRALAVQNTAQHVVAATVPPVAGLVIAWWGYGAAFALCAVLPLVAARVTPVADEAAVG